MSGEEERSVRGESVSNGTHVTRSDQPPAAIAEQSRLAESLWNDWVQKAARADSDALASLYDATHTLVYTVALRILGDVAEAEEITLDVYTQAWRTAGSFDPRRGNASAWLVMMARSRAIDRLRSRAARNRREEAQAELPEAAAVAESPEEASLQSQRRRIVRTAMAALSPEQREAIELAFFSGLSHSELAEKIGQPLGTAKTRIRLGMMRLRELLRGIS